MLQASATRAPSSRLQRQAAGMHSNIPAAPFAKTFATARGPSARLRTVHVCAAAGKGASVPHIQLATAKLPGAASVPLVAESLYQWASTMTQSGANYPFILPLKTDKLDTGFSISMLKKGPSGGFDAAGELQATVEEVAGQGNILFVRFYEGPAAMTDRRTPPQSDPQARIELVLQGLVDVDTIMSTMPAAIRNAVRNSASA